MSIDTKQLVMELSRFRYHFNTETDLQDGVAAALRSLGVEFERESAISPGERPDFLVGQVAIEIKIKGSLADLLRQVSRYAKQPGISEIIVLGTPYWMSMLPDSIGRKPLYGHRLLASLLS